MSHPNEPSVERLHQIKDELCKSSNMPDPYFHNKLLAINSQIRRREKEDEFHK